MPYKNLGLKLRAGTFAGAFGAAVLLAVPVPALAQQANVPADFTGIVRQAAPTVVAITTRQRAQEQDTQSMDDLPFQEFFRRYFGEGADPSLPQSAIRPRQALGSGFVISPDGHIITNNHVIENADQIQVVLGDGTNVPAKLVGRDPATDIAVLKIDPQPNMAIAPWGNSDTAEPGAWAIAIGSPFGLGGTVTVGVVSARSRDIRSGPYDDFLQTDAPINRGNSGGPLFNVRGEVVGVNTAILSPSGVNAGIGFAVPSNTAKQIADQLIKSGRVERGYVGLRLQEITPALAQALGRSDNKGALVASVEPGSPAERAGLKSGDVITQFNGQPVESGRTLSRIVAGMKPGAQAQVSVLRDGKSQDLTVAVGQRQEDPSQQAALGGAEGGKKLGVALAPVPDEARGRLGLQQGESGVLIQQVDPNSPAAETGLRAGDVIVTANNKPMNSPSEVASAWAEAQKQKKPILLRIWRNGQSMFVAVPA